jgi:pantetheine-phosphate adenylyltransferase
MTKAIYPGSFDPFTNGHLDMVKKASELFDEVTIVVAINKGKSKTYDTSKMCKAIETTLQANNITNCIVGTWDGLIADLMHQWKVKYLIRGLRNNMDYNYEENIAKINKLINPEIQTIYLRAESDISSSMVKELDSFGKDVSVFVPKAVYKLMKGDNNEHETL